MGGGRRRAGRRQRRQTRRAQHAAQAAPAAATAMPCGDADVPRPPARPPARRWTRGAPMLEKSLPLPAGYKGVDYVEVALAPESPGIAFVLAMLSPASGVRCALVLPCVQSRPGLWRPAAPPRPCGLIRPQANPADPPARLLPCLRSRSSGPTPSGASIRARPARRHGPWSASRWSRTAIRRPGSPKSPPAAPTKRGSGGRTAGASTGACDASAARWGAGRAAGLQRWAAHRKPAAASMACQPAAAGWPTGRRGRCRRFDGQSWTQVRIGVPGERVRDVAAVPGSPGRVWAVIDNTNSGSSKTTVYSRTVGVSSWVPRVRVHA